MDIFNLKRVEELERKLYEAEQELVKYRQTAAQLTGKLEEIGKLEESIPEDCIKGPWCKACEFVRVVHCTEYCGNGFSTTEPVYVCSKGKSCNNFIQKTMED